MKQFKVLFTLLMLVTFSAGFGKTTADLKQNSKTEFVTVDSISDTTINFVSVDKSASNDAIVLVSSDVTQFVQDKNFKPSYFAIITDVGWRINQTKFKAIAYNEKLLENCSLKIKLTKVEKRIRENPFKNDLVFKINRYW